MKRRTLLFGIFATAMLIVPAFAADDSAGITGVRWGRNAFGYEPLPSGPQPVTNLKRRRDGTSNGGQLVGDYNNPNLKPAAGTVVKQKGELAIGRQGLSKFVGPVPALCAAFHLCNAAQLSNAAKERRRHNDHLQPG